MRHTDIINDLCPEPLVNINNMEEIIMRDAYIVKEARTAIAMENSGLKNVPRNSRSIVIKEAIKRSACRSRN